MVKCIWLAMILNKSCGYANTTILLPIWELHWLIIPDISTFLLSGLSHLTWQPINFNGLLGLRYPQPLECRVTSLLSCHASVDKLLTAGGRYQYGRVGLFCVYMQQRHYLCSADAQSFWILRLLPEPCFSKHISKISYLLSTMTQTNLVSLIFLDNFWGFINIT